MIIVDSTPPSTYTPAPALSHRGHPPLFLLTTTTASVPSSTAGNLLLLGAGELFLTTSALASDPSSTAGALLCPLLLLFGAGVSTGASSWIDPHLTIMKMMNRRTSALSIRMGTVTIRSFSL